MRVWLSFGCFLLCACGTEPQKGATAIDSMPDTTIRVVSAHTDDNKAMDTVKAIPAVRTTKKPEGIYQFTLPDEGGGRIRHTVAFRPGTFRLQEEYPANKDSTVITEGTWATTEGYIWLYKDQILRARYTWKGDTLQYYSPRLKKAFPMNRRTAVTTANNVWQTKKKEGILLYGIGTEPFWSVEVTGEDSVVLTMPDWNVPLRSKITTAQRGADSTVYLAASDSLRLTVYSRFCSDGMSDFLYSQKIAVTYRGQTYKGCGEILGRAH